MRLLLGLHAGIACFFSNDEPHRSNLAVLYICKRKVKSRSKRRCRQIGVVKFVIVCWDVFVFCGVDW
jgi:hypothetical protein